MHPDMASLCLRNLLCVLLFVIMTGGTHTPILERHLIRIWKSLNRPFLWSRPARTNHRSNKFWEIDMTRFEP